MECVDMPKARDLGQALENVLKAMNEFVQAEDKESKEQCIPMLTDAINRFRAENDRWEDIIDMNLQLESPTRELAECYIRWLWAVDALLNRELQTPGSVPDIVDQVEFAMERCISERNRN